MGGPNLELNLCSLLGIDIEAKALAIVLADREAKTKESALDTSKRRKK